MNFLNLSEEVIALGNKARSDISPFFENLEQISRINSAKVLSAFRKHRVSDTMFSGTSGYGYNDKGRDTLDEIYAEIFGAESALVRIQFVNGTHALSCAIKSALKPKDTMLSVTGAPYDTLMSTIDGEFGSLKYYGINFEQVDLKDGKPDIENIYRKTLELKPSLIFIQRSKGYALRKSLSCEDIKEICDEVKKAHPDAIILVDNCYGEFCETIEPTQVGAHLIAGSLIKNPGGSLAPMGGYIAGKKVLVERAAEVLTAPGIGAECGATLGQNRLLYQGLFIAPHVTMQAVKTAIFCARIMELLGFEVFPHFSEPRYDIIQAIKFGSPEPLCAFCRGIQSGAPVDSYVTPEPWDMPGYADKVIMAAGAFVQGASIELSADAPMRQPYTCFMQGGITYESGELGILLATESIINAK